MGTYALSAGYYDAYYKRAQQVRQWLQWTYIIHYFTLYDETTLYFVFHIVTVKH